MTGLRPVLWQQQSCPSDLLKSAQCAKSWESMQKYEKVCQKLRNMPKVWENVLIAIFAVQMLFFAVQMIFFWCAVEIFWCAGKIILNVKYKLLQRVCHLLV